MTILMSAKGGEGEGGGNYMRTNHTTMLCG